MNNLNKNLKLKILQVAAKLFAKNGFEATSIREIADNLGTSKASLYYHFKSKEDILFQIINSELENGLVKAKYIMNRDSDPLTKLQHLISMLINQYIAEADKMTVLYDQQKSLNPILRDKLTILRKQFIKIVEDLLDEFKSKGMLNDINTKFASYSFFAMVMGSYRWYKISGPISHEVLSDNLFKIFSNGILKED